MTVGETLSASNLGPSGDRGVPDPVENRKCDPVTGGGAGPASNMGVVSAKVGQEVITSLHLIKDIRRLEKYQRDFFLKVKESLSHVQVLLDHQLMDMAWSDNLIDAEENLLKVSNHLHQSTASTQQLAELYGVLLHDREKLNHRFQELSVKSSLSEFVVNSRQLLDINAVRIAAETILKNEKPIPAQGDHTIPIDHTFFLANFCSASLASSMISSFKPAASNNSSSSCSNNNNNSSAHLNESNNAKTVAVSNNSPYSDSSASSTAGRVNGSASGMMDPRVKPAGGPEPMNGIGLANMMAEADFMSYDNSAADYMAIGANGGGLYGQHELVSAISQITASSQNKSAKPKIWPKTESADYGRPVVQPTSAAGDEDAISSNSEEVVDGSKPLSFARIASLNLEKQAAVNRPILKPAAVDGLVPVSLSMAPPAVMPGPHGVNFPLEALGGYLPMVPTLPPTANPRFFFDITMEGDRLGRVVIEVQPTVAPKMAKNFHMLVTHERGFGYKGCQFFQAWRNESVICGDWEHNSGRGGRAALDEGPLFTPNETKLPCIRGAVGMRRMSKKHSSLNQVASQFRVILANMNTQFTGIFGHVVCGIEALDKVANIGGDGGRPEKIAVVANCGIYKG